MKHLSLQWRITLLTALLIACACVCMNLLLYRTGVTGMDALNGFMMQYQPGSADPLTIEIPQEEMSSLLAHFSQEVYDAKVVFGRKGWCITVVVTIVSAAIAYFVSGRALKPLQQLAQQAQPVDQRIAAHHAKFLAVLLQRDIVFLGKGGQVGQDLLHQRRKGDLVGAGD